MLANILLYNTMTNMERRKIETLPEINMPISWKVSVRDELTIGLGTGLKWLALKTDNSEEADSIREYSDWLYTHYIIDDKAQAATVQHLIGRDIERDFFSDRFTNDFQSMIFSFEHECLGLDMGLSNGYYCSPAGYEGANYPTTLIARQVGMDVESFVNYSKNNFPAESYFVIKSDKFLIPVVRDKIDTETTFVTGIMELSSEGEKTLEMMLWSYEKGCEDQASSL